MESLSSRTAVVFNASSDIIMSIKVLVNQEIIWMGRKSFRSSRPSAVVDLVALGSTPHRALYAPPASSLTRIPALCLFSMSDAAASTSAPPPVPVGAESTAGVVEPSASGSASTAEQGQDAHPIEQAIQAAPQDVGHKVSACFQRLWIRPQRGGERPCTRRRQIARRCSRSAEGFKHRQRDWDRLMSIGSEAICPGASPWPETTRPGSHRGAGKGDDHGPEEQATSCPADRTGL